MCTDVCPIVARESFVMRALEKAKQSQEITSITRFRMGFRTPLESCQPQILTYCKLAFKIISSKDN